jgi:hypothetical protein
MISFTHHLRPAIVNGNEEVLPPIEYEACEVIPLSAEIVTDDAYLPLPDYDERHIPAAIQPA